MLERLACANNRNDEVLNVQLAHELCNSEDKEGINEIVSGLRNKNKKIANDCIKVLYEIGDMRPDLIADYADDFIHQLHSSNNRLVWGAMTALAMIVDIKHNDIYKNIDAVIYAFQHGSVITVDNGVSVLAKLCIINEHYREQIFPFLMGHLRMCRLKEVAQHAERISVCIDENNVRQFFDVLDGRIEYLTKAQKIRIARLNKKINKNILKYETQLSP